MWVSARGWKEEHSKHALLKTKYVSDTVLTAQRSSIFKYMSRPHAVHCRGTRDHAHGFEWARPGVARETDWLAVPTAATSKLGQRLRVYLYTVTFSLLGQRRRRRRRRRRIRKNRKRKKTTTTTKRRRPRWWFPHTHTRV